MPRARARGEVRAPGLRGARCLHRFLFPRLWLQRFVFGVESSPSLASQSDSRWKSRVWTSCFIVALPGPRICYSSLLQVAWRWTSPRRVFLWK